MINDFEIRAIAMQRSGHHAVINWISGLFEENDRVCFLNDFSRFKRPMQQSSYVNFSEEEIRKDIGGNFAKKKALIMNFEEIHVKDFESILKKNNNYPRGSSRKIVDILVLRDPYNMFASRYRRSIIAGNKQDKWIGKACADKWCEHARVFLNNKRILCINYNKWFSCIEYRRSLARRIGLKFNDRNISKVSKHGGGSSFDRMTLGGQDMKVLNRWEQYSDDPIYNKIFNKDVRHLSEKIFGDIR